MMVTERDNHVAKGVPTDPRTDASSVRNTKLCPYYVFHLHSESAIKKEQHTLDVALFFYYMDAAKRPSRFLHRHSPLSDRLGKSGAPGLVGGGNLCASAPIAMARAENSPHAHSVSRAQVVRTTFEKKRRTQLACRLPTQGSLSGIHPTSELCVREEFYAQEEQHIH